MIDIRGCRHRPSKEKYPIIVSQDGDDAAVWNLVTVKYSDVVTAIQVQRPCLWVAPRHTDAVALTRIRLDHDLDWVHLDRLLDWPFETSSIVTGSHCLRIQGPIAATTTSHSITSSLSRRYLIRCSSNRSLFSKVRMACHAQAHAHTQGTAQTRCWYR